MKIVILSTASWLLVCTHPVHGTAYVSSSQPQPRSHIRSENNRTNHHRDQTISETLRYMDEDEGENVSHTKVKQYELWEPELFQTKLLEWKDQYSDLIRVTTSQEKYGLPAAGGPGDCPFYTEQDGCPNFIFEIQDFVVHPPDSSSSNHLPEVFWSGCLHGNERVGPTSVMEAATLLLEAASCESLPRRPSHIGAHNESSETQRHRARDCRTALREKGIGDVHRKWLARLVTTRRIVVVPTANALGYFRNKREEGEIDPNRDFPYDLEDASKCMQTVAGRTLNEIYRDHLFQLALTFHAGMEVVAYEWGAPTWLNHFSPDDTAQESIASAYSRYGGGWSKSKPYQYGTMNDLVYYVRGGMEDWAYAGSWDPERVVQCQPKTFDGYPAEKTQYNNSTLRVFNFLIETSDNKEPHKSSLGTSLDVLSRSSKDNGHVSRNVRLALLAAELVEPYVSVVSVGEFALHDDLPPLSSRDARSCQKQNAYLVAEDASEIEIQFTVGGAMSVDAVDIWYAKWDDIPQDQVDCLSQPKSMDGFTQGTVVGARNGTGFFSRSGSHPRPQDAASEVVDATLGPIFQATIQIPPGLKTLDQLIVIASARVDQDWNNLPNNVSPKMGPQSHIVNARTDPNWHHHSADKHVVGRLDWFSSPVTIVIGDFKDSIGTHGADGLVKTVEMYPRFGGGAGNSGLKPKSATEDQLWFPVNMWSALALLLFFLAICLCCVMTRQNSNVKSASRYNQDDGFTFDSKPYSDVYEDEDLDDEDLNDNDGVELVS